MAHKTTYSEILERLEPPADLDKVIACKLCGQPMHWFLINKQVGFWIHRGDDIKVCAEKNPMMKGKPMIAQYMGFYRKTFEVWDELTREIVARQNSRKRKKLSKLQVVHLQPPSASPVKP